MTPPSPTHANQLSAADRAAIEPFARRLVRFCRYVLPLFLWMVFIFVMSTHLGSAENTAPFFARLLFWLRPDLPRELTPDKLDLLNYLLRKSAHVLEYAILSTLAVRAFQRDRVGWRWSSGLGAVALSLLYASTDEWHQKFVASRTGTIIDVGVDAIGVLLAVVLSWLWYRGNRSLSEELARLAALHDRGVLSDAEYALARKRALSS